MKLKTLKDIRIEGPYNKTENSLMNRCIRDTYREEAKNWNKQIMVALELDDESLLPKPFDMLKGKSHVKDWKECALSIYVFNKHFFNLEDEE